MKITFRIRQKWSLAVLGLGLATSQIQAQHINAGALSQTQGSQLYFDNAATYVYTSGFARSLNYSNSGQFAGWFNHSNPSFTAHAITNLSGPPSPNAAAPGAFLQLRIETVAAGPAGGTFAFWDHGNASTTPSISLSVGQTVASGNLFALSDVELGAGAPGADPFGHIHGRRFGVNLPGDYLVGFRIVDTSVNGLNGGPIHTDSELFLMTFRAVAVPEPTTAALLGAGIFTLGFRLRYQARQ